MTVLQVKKNQKKLYNQVKCNIEKSENLQESATVEKNRGRLEVRKVSLCKDLMGISEEFIGVRNIIKIERTVEHLKERKITFEEAYFISSLNMSSRKFNDATRSHWSIENSLHYVKDVTFKEDVSKIREGEAPENLSIRKYNYKCF